MKILDALLELLYPTRCAFCHKQTGGGQICRKCAGSLPYTEDGEQVRNFRFVEKCASPLYYEGDVRASLLRYKFNGLSFYWKIYCEILSKCVDENEISCDIITWVPLSKARLRQRGYDQARLLAEGLAEHMGVECARLLRKTRNNPAQSSMGGAEKRRANVSGAYEAVDAGRTEGRRVLIVDDIVTTGSTLSECAAVLTMAGAKSVTAATVARTRERKD